MMMNRPFPIESARAATVTMLTILELARPYRFKTKIAAMAKTIGETTAPRILGIRIFY